MQSIYMKPFSKWTIAEVEDIFHINIRKHHERLNQWLNETAMLTPAEENLLMDLRDKLQDHVRYLLTVPIPSSS